MTFIILIIVWIVLLSLELIFCCEENKWKGLIIPFVSFALSFFCLFAAYRFLITLPEANLVFVESMSIYAFICSNFPTIVYVVIYIIGRFIVRKRKRIPNKNSFNNMEQGLDS